MKHSFVVNVSDRFRYQFIIKTILVLF